MRLRDKFILISFFIFLTFIAFSVKADGCYQAAVMSPSPFMGNNGEIIKLDNGNIYEIKYSYEYLYEYYPNVTICPDANLLIIKDKKIQIKEIASKGGGDAQKSKSSVTEAFITSNFDGLRLGNVYVLSNGQVWEQAEAWIWVWIWVNPKVMIYKNNGQYTMKVEGIDHPVAVRRIK